MANSVSEAVGDAAKAGVDALALAGVTCTKRKTPSRPEGATNALPEVVVSVGEEGLREPFTPTSVRKTYPAAVTIVSAGGTKAADDPAVREMRKKIEGALALKSTWATITGYLYARVVNKDPFDPAALNKDFNYSTVVAEVIVIEPRN